MAFNSYQTTATLTAESTTTSRSRNTSSVHRTLPALTVAITLLSSFFTSQAGAASGDLDPTFGNAGMITTDFAGGIDEASCTAIQRDGRIVAAGWSFNSTGSSNFALARYNPDGRIDASFGRGGRVITAFGGNAKAYSVVIQSDGCIVAAGFAKNGPAGANVDFALARYSGDGSLDSSFGKSGKITTDFFGKNDQAYAVALQRDGRIVVAGGATSAKGGFGFAVARYNNDGVVDATFGNGGKIITFFAIDRISEARALVIQPDGKILLAGSGSPRFGTDFALARYNTDGSLDSTFGAGGKVTTDFFGSEDQARALIIQPDGRIVAAGYAGLPNRPSTDFAIARYNGNGTLDPAFGAGGKVTTDFFNGYDGVSALALQPDCMIVAAGMVSARGGSDFGLARYNGDGTLDTTFGSSGRIATEIGGAVGWASSIVIQQDRKIVAAGSAVNPATGNDDFALVRYGFEPFAKNESPNTANFHSR